MAMTTGGPRRRGEVGRKGTAASAKKRETRRKQEEIHVDVRRCEVRIVVTHAALRSGWWPCVPVLLTVPRPQSRTRSMLAQHQPTAHMPPSDLRVRMYVPPCVSSRVRSAHSSSARASLVVVVRVRRSSCSARPTRRAPHLIQRRPTKLGDGHRARQARGGRGGEGTTKERYERR